MKLHASGEDYLETILVLQKKLGMVPVSYTHLDVYKRQELLCAAVFYRRNGMGKEIMIRDLTFSYGGNGNQLEQDVYKRQSNV